jgi:hypothetical protein
LTNPPLHTSHPSLLLRNEDIFQVAREVEADMWMKMEQKYQLVAPALEVIIMWVLAVELAGKMLPWAWYRKSILDETGALAHGQSCLAHNNPR